MNMLKIISVGLFALTGTSSLSKNIQLYGAENCKKIDGWTTTFIEGVEISTMLPKRKLEFLFARQKDYRCMAVFDTPKGVFNCPVFMILSGDGGKTAFAQTLGSVRCEKG